MDALAPGHSAPDLADAIASINEAAAEEADFDDASETPSEPFQRPSSDSRLQKIFVSLPKSTLISPRSVFEPFEPPAPHKTEGQALQSLLRADPSQKNEDFVQFELDNFSCYVVKDRYPFEMRALHDHATRTGNESFFFDGTLQNGNDKYFVHGVEFDEIPLGNYGRNPETDTREPTVGDQLWVRSRLNTKKAIYYQLKKPSIEYARFHEAFLWVADLAKHMFDFCEFLLEHGRDVSIHDFKDEFGTWLREAHKTSAPFLKWYRQRNSNDFRQSVVANEPFLRKEMYGMFSPSKFKRLHIFQEIASPFNFYKRVGAVPNNSRFTPTIVTPYVYECFSGLRLGGLLKPVKPTVSVEEAIRLSWPEDKSKYLAFVRTSPTTQDRKVLMDNISIGDLISTPPDEKGSGTKWMTEHEDKKWYGLVQKVTTTSKGERRFDVTWLYQPDDTPCCSMKYPWANELFLSEHCTCDQGARSKVREDQVLQVLSVEWFGHPNTKAEFFVRQTYHTVERRFVTLEEAHLRCNHDEEPAPEFAVGDTVLVLAPGSPFLDVCELLEYLERNQTVRLRRLRRRTDFDKECAPNELVYTQEETWLSAHKVATRCIVRFYSSGETIPAPYNRGGTGNAFFITHQRLEDGMLQPLGPDRPRLRQGFDPNKSEEKLRALDLFCGCGNFGRGLEDGGAVEAKWANDIWETAIHTYMANTKHPEAVQPFLGSIDDLLLHGMKGKFSDAVPRPGQVQVISGGSPCPGFSPLTTDRTTLQQMKNRSLVASFASCIDFWRPAWGILENVRTIVQSKKNRTEDFFSQLICALVGMGYQTQIILGDAWAHGSPQTRVRAFLYFAAPGVNLPKPPYPSHSNPNGMGSGGLGRMTNGEPYVERTNLPTAFKYVTAGEATADLPYIYDAKPDTCVSFPDHRLSRSLTSSNAHGARPGQANMNLRAQVLNIPTRPYGMNFAKAWHGKDAAMFPHERDAFPADPVQRVQPGSRGWGRAHPHRLFGTITTSCHMTDARVGGSSTHWDQPRPLSVMEARRTQGVPDSEVLVGAPPDQWQMVGNGVARGISVALGLALREAAAGSLYEDGAIGGVPALGGVGGAAREEQQQPVSITSASGRGSRSSSRTPGLDTASTSVTGRFAPTPVAQGGGGGGGGKRSRSRRSAAAELPCPPPNKRPRVAEELDDELEVVRTVVDLTVDDDDDGDCEDDDDDDDEEGGGGGPLRSATGATVVRMLSEELGEWS